MLVVPLLNSSIRYFIFYDEFICNSLWIVCDVIFSLMRIIFKNSIYTVKNQMSSASCWCCGRAYVDIRNVVRTPVQKFNFFFEINEFIYQWIHLRDEFIDFCRWIHQFLQMNSSILQMNSSILQMNSLIFAVQNLMNSFNCNKWIRFIVVRAKP